MNRSYLFVPADSERKLRRAADVAADAVILDLEDSVTAGARPEARALAARHIENFREAWVRVNPLESDDIMPDLQAVMPAGPAGIMIPKVRSGNELREVSRFLHDLEEAHGIEAGRTRVIAISTERPEALLNMHSYVGVTARLTALAWGAEDLSAALGAMSNRDEGGNWLPPYELARSLCLVAAAAAGVSAIDTVYTDFRDIDGLARYAANARRDGFSGMLAIHPDQVDVINRLFTPSAAELERARRIVALFDENPGAGVVGLDGQMIDRPHLVQARRILELAKRLAAT